MRYSRKCSFFLASIVVQALGELIMVQHPPGKKNYARNVTCISEDDDVALVWNYDTVVEQRYNISIVKNFTSFQPDKSKSQNMNRCEKGILNSGCSVEWDENVRNWEKVGSRSSPMGPVHDYRWEGFQELPIDSRRFSHVGKISATSISFSVRGARKINMVVCNPDKSNKSPCIWMIIEGKSHENSNILFCYGQKADRIPKRGNNCKDIANTSGLKKVIETDEWRTFRLEWGGGQKYVTVFENIDKMPFLQGEISIESFTECYITVYSDPTIRVRFHDYNYLETKRDRAVISTEVFESKKGYVCFKLLVGLCSKCKMKIDLVYKGRLAATQTISGNTTSTINGLLIWQPVTLHMQDPERGDQLKLQIQALLGKANVNEGHWALDKVRMCKSDRTSRKSTITIHRHDIADPWPRIVCQKLSFGDYDVVDLSEKDTKDYDKSRVQQTLKKWRESCNSSCEIFGKGLSICNAIECSCDRGFEGPDCTKECASGFHGYNCKEKCGSCKGRCDKETGHCEGGCGIIGLQPPLCTQRDPTASLIYELNAEASDTEVTLQWKTHSLLVNEIVPGCEIVIKNVKLLGCKKGEKLNNQSELPPIACSTNSVSVPNLHPYAKYEAIVTPLISTRGDPGMSTDFETNPSATPTSVVNNLQFNRNLKRIEWDEPKDCTTITSPTYTKLCIRRVNDTKCFWIVPSDSHYDPSSLFLEPYTWYEVFAYVSRDRNGKNFIATNQMAKWQTAPVAPPAVNKAEVYSANLDDNTIFLRWLPPNPPKGVTKTYHISVSPEKEPPEVPSERQANCTEDYICYSFTVPKNSAEDKINITVYAKNDGVNERGASTTIPFDPISYFKEKCPLPTLDLTNKDRGIVEVKWTHPSVSFTTISQFAIHVELVSSELLVQPVKKNFTIEHPAGNTQYTETLFLSTSTLYQISVVAINRKNFSSEPAQKTIRTVNGLEFAIGEELKIEGNKEDGSLIDVVVPTVLNATNNTSVTLTIVGPLTCRENNSKPLELQKWEVAVYMEDGKGPKHLTIGANHTQGVKSNCSLHIGKTYTVRFVAEVHYKEQKSSKKVLNRTSRPLTLINNKSTFGNRVWLVILPIVAILLLLVFLIRWRKMRKSTPVRMIYSINPALGKGNVSAEHEEENCLYVSNKLNLPPSINPENRVSLSHVYAVPFVPDTNSVSMIYFEEYAKEIAFNGVLATQCTTFPRGLTRACDYGRLPQNMPKNRNTNLIAYDETRIVLEKNRGEPHSDYINASYVQGYGEKNAYIATQGPKPNTVNDFWRMIWQKRVLVICMLTNVMENGEKMCEEYWPAVEREIEYGDITISNIEHQVLADYTVRTFRIRNKRETRTVTHLHYMEWPSRGVPIDSQSLVSYLKKLVEILDGRGPVVVHCSEGDGRTGAVILCDMCIRQGIVEKGIDVPWVAKRMCESRANMIGSPQQYLLAHVVIAESINSISTQIPCNDALPVRIKALRKHLPSHIQRLNGSVWQEQALHSFASSDHPVSGMSFNVKSPELISVGPDVVRYQRYTNLIDNDSNYIGAISVDGVRVKNQNLTSRLPSSSGLPDFWRFVAEQNIELIVILQRPEPDNPMFCDIMPGESILVPVDYIQIVTKSSSNEGGIFAVDKLMLNDRSEETPRPQLVTVLTCNGWGCGLDEKPPAAGDLVSLWQASEKIPRKGGLSLVLCRNGVNACGLYLAMSFLLERMAVDKQCDVISAVRAVRRSRPEFVQSLEQFEYLYDAALNYAGCFQTYANFS